MLIELNACASVEMSSYLDYQKSVRNTILAELHEDIGWDKLMQDATKKSTGTFTELAKRDKSVADEAAKVKVYTELIGKDIWKNLGAEFDKQVKVYVDLPYRDAAGKAAAELYQQAKNAEAASLFKVFGYGPGGPKKEGDGPTVAP